MPSDDSVHLPLSMPAAVHRRSTHLDPFIKIEPLLAQHGKESSEEGSGQTRVKDGLNVDGGGIWAGPFGELDIITGLDNPKCDAGGNRKELIAKFLVILLEVRLNSYDEGRCDRREQTGLCSQKNKL